MPAESNYRRWNRRLHYFLGLYFLFFIWLFALTGLVLNHSWSFSEFWPQRKVTTSEHAIQRPTREAPLAQARDVMRQLGLAGEIQWLGGKPAVERLEFRVTRPGTQYDIKADWNQLRAAVQRTEINAWGSTRTLHTFTGVRINDRANERDWIVTTLWSYSMDALAAGLIVMVISGVIMWLALPGKRLAGGIALLSGIVICGWLVFALRWFAA